MPENIFVGSVARAYDASAPEMFTPEVLDVTTAFLADAASGGRALEFAIGTSIPDAERRLIVATLEHLKGDKREAARVLGIGLKTLYNRLREYSNENTPS